MWFTWHLNGKGVWTASLLSFFVILALVLIQLRVPKRICTKASLYTILIALSGLAVIIINQAHFIRESVNPGRHSDILIALRKFTLTRACDFLRQFFPTIMDLLVFSDCINRYILIYYPQRKSLALSWKFLMISMGCILGISSLIAAMAARLEHEIHTYNTIYNVDIILALFHPGSLAKKTLLYLVVLKGTISIAISGFFIVITARICRVLNKGVQFLKESHAGSESIARYSKVMRFSFILCIIVVVFNFILDSIDLGLMAWMKLYSLNFISHISFSKMHKISVGRSFLKTIFSLKPGFYGLAYIWIKLS